ncbi:acyl-CoA dehydrogenase [Motiliproteus coralliicola]|uniref:Acyl-CoA dehydrogenase n=1 Tax=Motiliproteus coralliicola TaxID=2283196 RepID=A0A369WV00_9GAMM|nr:acyl-CoA dehydrogenase family protein [Motiliproteus coralliicola]RDE24374.1 acyl-CoA dehydrogenase [Motiliproteus coralliicola]
MSALSYFGETHQLIRATASAFVDQQVRPNIDEWEEQGSFPRELYRQAGEAGLLGINYPESLGGTGGDLFQKVVWLEELMRAGSGGLTASLCSLDIGLPPLVKYGSAELKERVVPQVLCGEKVYALAITEPSGGSDVANLKTRARRETIDGQAFYRVNGGKTFITSATRADYFTVAVRTGEAGYGGVSLLMVEKGCPGFSVGQPLKKMGWWASDTAELFFDDCLVPEQNLIGEENSGFRMITANFQSERLTLAVMANMTAQLALEACQDYVRERQAFGRPLAGLQTIRHRLADMATQLEASREFTYRCAARMDNGEQIVKEISMAKNFATDVSDKLTHDAVQIFGGMGYMRESLVARLYRDNRILSIGGGTREIMNEIISKQLLG